MKVTSLSLPEVLLIEPSIFGDGRGYFMESWNRERYAQAGIDIDFVQSNVSRSAHGVLRGLHYQNPNPQGKLVYVTEGEVFDVAVDIRPQSPRFGQWVGALLSAENHHQLYVPPGFAHGFCVIARNATFCYLCTTLYDAAADASIAWNDPVIGIDWPVEQPSLSNKDLKAPNLADIDANRLPS